MKGDLMKSTTLNTLNLIVFILSLLVWLCFFTSCKQGNMFEWHSRVGAFNSLDESGIEYAVQVPAKFGYKTIFIKIPQNTNNSDLKADIEVAITNLNEDYIHVVSPDFFTGELPIGDTAIIFKGTIEELVDFYARSQPPSISNSKDNTTILVKIKTSKKIDFKEPVIIDMEASDYP